MDDEKYISPTIENFYYILEPRTSTQVTLNIFKDKRLTDSKYFTKNEGEPIDQFVIRLHSLARGLLKERIDDESGLKHLRERLGYENLVKAGQLKNDLEIK